VCHKRKRDTRFHPWGRPNDGLMECPEEIHPSLAEQKKVEIRELYRDYTPPVDATAVVSQLLRTVPDKYLQGLECVVLTNESGMSRKDRLGKVWSRKRKYDKSRVIGRYHPRSRTSRPYIELRVDKIIAGLKGMPLRIPFPRKLVFGHVMFHELGHHIHYTMRPQHAEKEDVADKWAGKLSANFIRKQYWYALPLLIPAFKIYRFMRSREESGFDPSR
jgi:hypothetical protein